MKVHFPTGHDPKHTAKTMQEALVHPKYRCAKFVVSYPRRLEAVIAAKGDSTK